MAMLGGVEAGRAGEMESGGSGRHSGQARYDEGLSAAAAAAAAVAVKGIEWPVAAGAVHARGCKVIQAPATECKSNCGKQARSLLCSATESIRVMGEEEGKKLC